jgi:hypothetical protein
MFKIIELFIITQFPLLYVRIGILVTCGNHLTKYNLNCHYLGLTFDWTNTEIYWTVSQSNIVYSATFPSDTSASISTIATKITFKTRMFTCWKIKYYTYDNFCVRKLNIILCIMFKIVELLIITQFPLPPREKTRPCKWFPHVTKMPILTYSRGNCVIINNSTILNIMHNIIFSFRTQKLSYV